jgi:Flp pilus assembly pilin Flp
LFADARSFIMKWRGNEMRRNVRTFWRDEAGQDLIEYALISATLAVVVAGFLPPTIMPAVSNIFSKISSSMAVS